jgi:pimeloyl-ACP methyl ester carboxylesterase
VSGPISSRYYAVDSARRGVVWVGGIVGGFDSPARNLFPELATTLRERGIASLRVRLRRPGWIPGSVLDVRAGIRFLRKQGIRQIALVGHSIGSAIVLQAALAERRSVRAVVFLSTLNVGAKALDGLAPGCACLFVHGGRDAILPSWFSVRMHARAADPKRLIVLPHAGHRLSEGRATVRKEILAWLDEHLAASAAS